MQLMARRKRMLSLGGVQAVRSAQRGTPSPGGHSRLLGTGCTAQELEVRLGELHADVMEYWHS